MAIRYGRVQMSQSIFEHPSMDAPEPAGNGNGRAMLEAEGIWKSFGAKQVLKGVDLSVAKGEVLVILGPNGCGKSTFLRCINLLELYQKGRIRLNGVEVSQGTPDGHHPSGIERASAQALRKR